MKEVVRIAMMVPMGMDLWASRRSPDLLQPAIMPKIKKPSSSNALSRFLNYDLFCCHLGMRQYL